MKPHIDPKVDCVFKSILGKEENKALLIHFLNAVLSRTSGVRIQDVQILNPYNEREFESDKLSVVDIKARDDQERSYQVEIQLALHPGLTARMLYTWSTIYHDLIRKGQTFTSLQPVIAIWLLNESVFAGCHASHLPFEIMNREHGIVLSDHLQIHLLQLPDWHLQDNQQREIDRWMFLFKEGQDVDVEHPPAILHTREMTQAIHVLQHIAENEAEYLLYQQRLEALQVEETWKAELERLKEETVRATLREAQERQGKEEAKQREEQARQREKEAKQREEQAKQREEQAKQREEQERREKERLLELLKQAGIHPNIPSDGI